MIPWDKKMTFCTKETHFFKFEAWKKSMDIIYIIDGFIIVAIAIYLQYWLFNMIDITVAQEANSIKFAQLSMQLQDPSLSETQKYALYTEFMQVEEVLLPDVQRMMDNYGQFINYSLFLALYFVKNAFQMIFSKLNGKKIRFITPENIVNFISMVISVYLFCRWHFYVVEVEIDPPKYYPLAATERAFNDPVVPGIVNTALCVALQWCRVFFILQASRIFGPLIEILISMIVELFKFSAIYLLIFMIFLTAGMVMFFNLPEFQENWKGAIYLFNASLGNFSFETFTFDNSRLDKEYGWVYMILFLILTNIVLINFLIAVLSNRYTVMEGKSTVLYLQNILRIKQVQTEHKYYSALVSSFVPLNLLILPFAPFLILCKNEKLNCMLLYICYSPVVILGVVAFIA